MHAPHGLQSHWKHAIAPAKHRGLADNDSGLRRGHDCLLQGQVCYCTARDASQLSRQGPPIVYLYPQGSFLTYKSSMPGMQAADGAVLSQL